mmetsp:Transcript_31461/g.52055  ORF Transcript_31461/g.52055 Transcript_31461/m.52055 type:complete len:543 (-) Transcript_31461:257-1885(-)
MKAGVRIHPLKLSFSNPALERKIRARQFVAASSVYMMVLIFLVPLHTVMAFWSSRYTIISCIYLPLILIAIGAGMYLPVWADGDQFQAHTACSRLWMGLLTVGPVLQRISIYVGLHPRIEPMQSIIYMGSYVGCIIMWYIMHFDFYHKLYNKTMIFLSLSTAGWQITGDEGWTALGQPYDTATIAITIVVGSVFGYCVERMLRTSFLQRHLELQNMSVCLPSRIFRNEFASDVDELMSPSAGVQFEKVGLVGRGGTGDVFLVRKVGNSSSGELSAMKRIAKAKLTPSQTARVLEECEILKGISHPFIVKLESAYETPVFFLLEMTYAGGGDLTYWIGRFTAAAARQVGAEVLLALDYLHEQSILYRDVKPENTLVAIDGHVMLADFGVSKRLFGATKNSTRTLVGTPEYMAPEQFTGEDYSFEIDFWAFAVMQYELLTSMGIGSRMAPTIAMEGLMDDLSTDLLKRMLMPDRSQRLGHPLAVLGCAGVEPIKTHPYFESVDFAAVLRKEGPGPLLTSGVGTGKMTNLSSASTDSYVDRPKQD